MRVGSRLIRSGGSDVGALISGLAPDQARHHPDDKQIPLSVRPRLRESFISFARKLGTALRERARKTDPLPAALVVVVKPLCANIPACGLGECGRGTPF
ncbi:hypothetical protein GCM10020227_05530 [Streptomyces flavovirens]